MIKKVIATIAVLIVLCSLSACSVETYEDGYEDGYADGYFDAESEMACIAEEEFYDGYDFGYDDGHDDVLDIIERAEDHVRDQTGWSVYEAWSNISVYNDGVDPYGHPLPTREEYLQSIETLVLFCEYLDNEGLLG